MGFVEEIEWWWSRQRGCRRVWRSVFTTGVMVRRIQQAGDVVFDDHGAAGTEHLPTEQGLYLPLEPSLFERCLDPCHLLEIGRLRGLVWAHLNEANRSLLSSRLRRGARPRFLVLGVPRPSGDRALIAVEIIGPLDPHPLRETTPTSNTRLEPVLIERLDRG